MLRNVFISVFALLTLLSSPFAAANQQLPTLFQRAMSQGSTGNSFASGYVCTPSASGTSCTSPYGGSMTQDYSQWNGRSGSTSWSYNNFTISVTGITMTVNGSFTYNGSVSDAGILDGTMTANLTYDITTAPMSYGGYTIPATTQRVDVALTAIFSNGNANITMTSGGKTINIVWSQGQLVSYLY